MTIFAALSLFMGSVSFVFVVILSIKQKITEKKINIMIDSWITLSNSSQVFFEGAKDMETATKDLAKDYFIFQSNVTEFMLLTTQFIDQIQKQSNSNTTLLETKDEKLN